MSTRFNYPQLDQQAIQVAYLYTGEHHAAQKVLPDAFDQKARLKEFVADGYGEAIFENVSNG